MPSRAPAQTPAHIHCHTRSLLVPGPRRPGGPADCPTHGLEGPGLVWGQGDPQAALLEAGGRRHLTEAAATDPRPA